MESQDPHTFAIIGAAMDVHRELGSGFLEPVYQEALAVELQQRKITFQREAAIKLYYKNQPLHAKYRADFICFKNILVELKALQQLSGKEDAQVLNYLKATGLKKALLINFGERSLRYKRLVY